MSGQVASLQLVQSAGLLSFSKFSSQLVCTCSGNSGSGCCSGMMSKGPLLSASCWMAVSAAVLRPSRDSLLAGADGAGACKQGL